MNFGVVAPVTAILVILPHFQVADAAEGEALCAIAAGQEFGLLCASLAGGWLVQWLQDGLIANVSAGSQAAWI